MVKLQGPRTRLHTVHLQVVITIPHLPLPNVCSRVRDKAFPVEVELPICEPLAQWVLEGHLDCGLLV